MTLPFLFGNLVALQAPGSLQLILILLHLPFLLFLGCSAASSGHNTVLGSKAISKAVKWLFQKWSHLRLLLLTDIAMALSLMWQRVCPCLGAFQASVSTWEIYEIRAFPLWIMNQAGPASHPPIPGKVPISSPTPLLCSVCIIMPQQRPCLLMICLEC